MITKSINVKVMEQKIVNALRGKIMKSYKIIGKVKKLSKEQQTGSFMV